MYASLKTFDADLQLNNMYKMAYITNEEVLL